MSIKDFHITLQKFLKVPPLSDYIIPINGLKNGLHPFNYDVDIDFLHQHDFNDLFDIKVKAIVNLYKNNRIFDVEIRINGTAVSECDRCTDELTIDLNFIHHLVFKLENIVNETTDDDIIFLPESTTEINLAPYVYEAIVFSLPMKKIHPDDTNGKSLCNQEIIKHLNKYLIHEPTTDPRWDTLKKLLN